MRLPPVHEDGVVLSDSPRNTSMPSSPSASAIDLFLRQARQIGFGPSPFITATPLRILHTALNASAAQNAPKVNYCDRRLAKRLSRVIFT